MVHLRTLLAATLTGATSASAAENFRGRLEIQYEHLNTETHSHTDTLKVCVLNFNYHPDPRRCEDAPEGKLESKSEIGIFGTGQVAISGHGSRQVDLPFTAVWPGDLSVITWTGKDERVHTFSGELKAGEDWKRINVQDVHLRARVTCLANFYGEDCNTICISPSESQKKVVGFYSCNKNGEKVCDPDFETGPNDELPCQRRICPANCAECSSNGRCRKCEPGYYRSNSRTCEMVDTPRVITSPCESSPCGDNGNCIVKGNSFQCLCKTGFIGTLCEVTAAPVPLTAPCTAICANNGVCIEGNKCYCPEGFTGEFCEIEEKDTLLLGIVAGVLLSVLGGLVVVAGVIIRRRSQMRKNTSDVVFEEDRIMEDGGPSHSRAEGDVLISSQAETIHKAAYSKPSSPVKPAKHLQDASFITTSSDMSLSAPPSYNEALQS